MAGVDGDGETLYDRLLDGERLIFLDFLAFLRVPVEWFFGLTLRWRVVLGLLVVVSLMEFVLHRLEPSSRLYHGFSAAIRWLGEFWTAIILSIAYVLAVGPVNLVFRLTKRDLLDRKLGLPASVWRPHVPNPLGPESAARHQF